MRAEAGCRANSGRSAWVWGPSLGGGIGRRGGASGLPRSQPEGAAQATPGLSFSGRSALRSLARDAVRGRPRLWRRVSAGKAPPAPGGRSRNSGRGLSRPFCRRRRRRHRARARSSSRSRSPAAGVSRPGSHRRRSAVSRGGPTTRRPGAREGWALAEDRAERPGSGVEGNPGGGGAALRGPRGVQAARSGAGTNPPRAARDQRPALGGGSGACPAGTCGFGGPGFRARVRAPCPGPKCLPSHARGPGRGGGLCPWAAVKPGREHLKVCWKMIDCGWCLLATVFLILKPPAGLLNPALGDFSAPKRD